MDEYFCPNCGATLNDQYGFDPCNGSWTCTMCGMHLMDDDVYEGDTFEGVAWYCDDCGALLNRQSGFTDSLGSWQCTNCGHVNGTTEDEIINTGPQCPNCSSYLKNQSYYGGYEDDWTCEECGTKLHREYSSDPYEAVHEDMGPKCPSCDTPLKKQCSFFDWLNDYTCDECGAKLHRNYICDPFEVVHENNDPICPHCGDRLNSQLYYSEYEDDWTCEACGTKLHRDYCCDSYEEIDEYTNNDTDGDDSVSASSPPSFDSDTYFNAHSTHASSNEKVKEPKAKPIQESELRKIRIKAFLFKKKKVRIGYEPCDLLRRSYKYVSVLLQNCAFNNIKCVPNKDIHVGSPYEVGEVEQIVINGSQHFSVEDMVPYDTDIIITYHAKAEIAVPFDARFCRKKNYTKIGDQLQRLGFTNIYERAIRDLTTGWVVKDGSIATITIGGNASFKKNAVYAYDTKIVIEYHTFKNKK